MLVVWESQEICGWQKLLLFGRQEVCPGDGSGLNRKFPEVINASFASPLLDS